MLLQPLGIYPSDAKLHERKGIERASDDGQARGGAPLWEHCTHYKKINAASPTDGGAGRKPRKLSSSHA